MSVTFPKTSTAEYTDLRRIVTRNCTCPVPPTGAPAVEQTCSAHQLITDQRLLNHLLFVRANRRRYVHGERWM